MKLNKRAVTLLILLAVLLTVVAGSTLAYIVDKTQDAKNTFTPSRVACEVVDENNHTYTVQNTGDTAAYIRVSVVVNWKSDDGGFYAQAPNFEVTPDADWVIGKDGYFYYIKPVAVGDQTAGKLTLTVQGAAPADHTLSVVIVASAIQATAEAVQSWSDGVAAATKDGDPLTVISP